MYSTFDRRVVYSSEPWYLGLFYSIIGIPCRGNHPGIWSPLYLIINLVSLYVHLYDWIFTTEVWKKIAPYKMYRESIT